MSFKTIETQEQFDEMIQERIGKAKDSVRKEFEGFISPEQYESLKGYTSPEDVEAKIAPMAEQIQSLSDALASAKEKIEKLGEDVTSKTAEISQKDSLIKQRNVDLWKFQAAVEYGVPIDVADRLKGEDLDALRQDAKYFSQYSAKAFTPLKDAEPNSPIDGVTKAFMELNPNIKL